MLLRYCYHLVSIIIEFIFQVNINWIAIMTGQFNYMYIHVYLRIPKFLWTQARPLASSPILIITKLNQLYNLSTGYIKCIHVNKNVDIKFSVHDTFLERPSFTLKIKRLESQIIKKKKSDFINIP
jgi:hypothetical protein